MSEANGNTQLALIEGESDEVMLEPVIVLQKRYTAAVVEKIELKKNYILDLLGFGLPIETVAERTHSSTRTVNMLGAKYSELVAANSMNFAQVLKQKAARFLFLAEQKAPQAKFGELMVGVGIAAQRGQELELGAAGALNGDGAAIDVSEENQALQNARKFLEERKVK